MKLNRQSLLDGSMHHAVSKILPADIIWSLEQIKVSMLNTLKQRPSLEEPVWVFAHGSLMWSPMLAIEEIRKATLLGWQRSFCLRLVSGRANLQQPGRMMSLQPDGNTEGIAFRLSDHQIEQELMSLFSREMITGAYNPRWLPVTLHNGHQVNALTFVYKPDHRSHELDSTVDTVVDIIKNAQGPLGSNSDYVFQLEDSLSAWNISDKYIAQIAYKLRLAKDN